MMNEISNCLKFTDQQELQIDENKMNKEAIRVKESKLMCTTVTSKEEDDNNKSKLRELEKILLRNPASVSVILKTTKIFDKTHFLMLISKQERLVGGSSQASITNYEVAFSKVGIHSDVYGGAEGPVKQLAGGGEAGVH
jgi:CRISPR/Cas system CMR subunit Cmr6 (Cas7 group RAMP superfamily)